jgi:ubiquinone/menaquinone biosynthesis C-methylase UbiE
MTLGTGRAITEGSSTASEAEEVSTASAARRGRNRPAPGGEREGAMTEASRQWSKGFELGSLDGMTVYDRIVAHVFAPWAHDIVDRLVPSEGSTVLDVACGPGTVTHLLAARVGPSGRVIAADISPSMLAIGRSKPASGAPIEWIEAPASPLPLETASVDGVTCQQGLQFFPDKTAALDEMRRVLVPGGRAIVATWTAVEEQDFWGTLQASIAAAWSAELAERYQGPFSLTGEAAAKHAADAGFESVNLETITMSSTLEGGARALVESLAASGIASEYAAMSDDQRSKLLEEVTKRASRLEKDGDLHGSLTASVLTLS